MAADYPGAIKNFLTLEDGVDTVLAQHMNERGDEITAMETELGADVAGSVSDLVTRLAVAVNNDGTIKDDAITPLKLKTATVEVNSGASTIQANYTLTGAGSYGFWPQLKGHTSGGYGHVLQAASTDLGDTYITNIGLDGGGTGNEAYAQMRYVTASGIDMWIFILRNKETKEIFARSQAPDHPSYGNGGNPELVPHPFRDYDETKQEIILIEKESAEAIKKLSKEAGKSILTLITEDYNIGETEYKYKPLHSGKFLGEKQVIIKSIPDYIKVRKLTRRK